MLTVRFSLLLSIPVLFLAPSASATTTLLLDTTSAPSSTFYEFFSDGFYRMDLFATSQPTHQNFHNITDPNIQYGQGFDGFPNDEAFRFGRLEFDESVVAGGTGDAPITGLTFGVRTDPFDATYENYRRWTGDTTVENFTGNVELENGLPVGLDLTIDFTITVTAPLGLTGSGDYPGTFVVEGTDFTLQAEGMPEYMQGTNVVAFGLEWDLLGEFTNFNVLDLADPPGDYDRNGEVNEEDYELWVDTFGGTVPRYSGADANGIGTIDAASYTIWRDHYAPVASEATAVPEPAALTLLAPVAILAVPFLRNRR